MNKSNSVQQSNNNVQQRSKYGLSDEQTDQLMSEEMEREVSDNI